MVEVNTNKEEQKSISLGRKRVLYLTKDPRLIERQLAGENLGPFSKQDLLDRVSTDTYPTRACFRFDKDYLAQNALTGLSLGHNHWVCENEIKNGGFGAIVAGASFGCGSSREHFPMSLKAAGIDLIIAESIERICAQNCQNIGLPYLEQDKTNLLYRLISGRSLPLSLITENMDSISRAIILKGGLFPYFKQYPSHESLPKPETHPRPMTGPEKIIAEHMGIPYVKPGDNGFIEADKKYSYEIFFPFSYHLLREHLPDSPILKPESVFLFYDHSVLDESPEAFSLAEEMRKIASLENLKLYDGNKKLGAEGICHTLMLDNHTLPGEVILGTDSHTCQLGAAGALSIGIGATEWAAALWTNKIRISVPRSLRFELKGAPPSGVMAKDIMLYLLSLPYIKDGYGIGKIFEFSGESFNCLKFDEQVVFANMAVEGGAFTGFITPNENSILFIMKRHNLSSGNLLKLLHYSDQGAEYDNEFLIDISSLEPYIALPGDPRNGIPLSELLADSKIDKKVQKAYIGSCTGSKYEDIVRAAAVLEGRKVHPDTKLFVQTSSREVFRQAFEEGLIKIIEESGGTILPPGCGACVNFGPGSFDKGEQGISSTNRNFPGRMGRGSAFLANPAIVAASAVAGEITSPELI